MLIDRQRPPGHGGRAAVGVHPVQRERACPSLDEIAGSADGATERRAVVVAPSRQGETPEIDPSVSSNRSQRAISPKLQQSTRADGQGCATRQAPAQQQRPASHIGCALICVGTTKGQLTLSRFGERPGAGHAPRKGDREARVNLPGAPIRSQQKGAIGRGANRVRDLRTQHTTIDNERAISLCGTTKEIDSGVSQRAAINGQNWS